MEVFVWLVFICVSSSFSNGQLNVSQVNVIKSRINQAIDDSYDAFFNTHPLIAGAVRLVFHDCVGGCDGCINHEDDENAGLEDYTDQLDPIYDSTFSTNLSRADFYVLASITALERASMSANCFESMTECWPQLTFRYGRPDCSTSPDSTTDREFPDPHQGMIDHTSYFSNKFNFTERETVAIMGAHTLGRTHIENSGFEGRQNDAPDALDHRLYVDIQDAGPRWTQVDNTPFPISTLPHYQWDAQRMSDAMVLNSDMSMYLNMTQDATGYVSCVWSECPRASTSQQVFDYAVDNDAWIRDFSAAFNKLIENENSNLVLPSP